VRNLSANGLKMSVATQGLACQADSRTGAGEPGLPTIIIVVINLFLIFLNLILSSVGLSALIN
jgi:hypothetical protein